MSVQNYSSEVSLQAMQSSSSIKSNENMQGQWNGKTVTNRENLTQHSLQSETVRFKNNHASNIAPRESLKRSHSQIIDLTKPSTNTTMQLAKKDKKDMQISFLQGEDDHIHTYAKCIDEAKSQIIIASWNLNFIPKKIFSSLIKAKRRKVPIGLIVQSIKREGVLDCFYGDEDSPSGYYFECSETKSHAKFLFVDSKILVLGSYNALGDSYEESLDASIMLKGTEAQLWPFYMSIFETYTSIEEDLSNVFGSNAKMSKFSHTRPRRLLRREFEDGSQIFLLRTIQEHEDFFRLATPYNGDVSIYSPFSTKDNTFKRLQALERILPTTVKVYLKVLPKFRNGLTRLLSKVPNLQNRVSVETANSHQKVVILGSETICVGSLNWLSAAQDQSFYSNAELSIVLQGPKANNIIKQFYSKENS